MTLAPFVNKSFFEGLTDWKVAVRLFDLLSVGIGVRGRSNWPPWLYPYLTFSVRRRVWKHFGINACDLGTFSISVFARRLYIVLGLFCIWVDAPLRDRAVFRFSLYDLFHPKRSSYVLLFSRGKESV